MQVKNALNWKIFVLLLCDINQQYQKVLDTHSNTIYLQLFHLPLIRGTGYQSLIPLTKRMP